MGLGVTAAGHFWPVNPFSIHPLELFPSSWYSDTVLILVTKESFSHCHCWHWFPAKNIPLVFPCTLFSSTKITDLFSSCLLFSISTTICAHHVHTNILWLWVNPVWFSRPLSKLNYGWPTSYKAAVQYIEENFHFFIPFYVLWVVP